MNWPEISTIAVAAITVIGFLYTMYRNLRLDIARYRQEAREEFAKFNDQMLEQSKRSDKLYEMFIEHRKEIDQKFYDMLKEKKSN